MGEGECVVCVHIEVGCHNQTLTYIYQETRSDPPHSTPPSFTAGDPERGDAE